MLLEVLHFPGILCAQGLHTLHFPGILAHKGIIGALVGLMVSKRPFWANLIQTWTTLVVDKARTFLQSIFRERNMYKYALT